MQQNKQQLKWTWQKRVTRAMRATRQDQPHTVPQAEGRDIIFKWSKLFQPQKDSGVCFVLFFYKCLMYLFKVLGFVNKYQQPTLIHFSLQYPGLYFFFKFLLTKYIEEWIRIEYYRIRAIYVLCSQLKLGWQWQRQREFLQVLVCFVQGYSQWKEKWSPQCLPLATK